jgi:GNAT superfamily N-acetyltransferase
VSHHIRPAEAEDLPACLALDDSYTTNIVWQVAEQRGETLARAGDEEQQHAVTFRPTRLPRPRLVAGLAKNAPHEIRANWQHTDFFSVAIHVPSAEIAGYLNLHLEKRRSIVWLTALVVAEAQRRSGVGTALLDEAKEWARLTGAQSIMAELPTVNYPAAHFLYAQGFRFCGYNDALDPARMETILFFAYPLH